MCNELVGFFFRVFLQSDLHRVHEIFQLGEIYSSSSYAYLRTDMFNIDSVMSLFLFSK